MLRHVLGLGPLCAAVTIFACSSEPANDVPEVDVRPASPPDERVPAPVANDSGSRSAAIVDAAADARDGSDAGAPSRHMWISLRNDDPAKDSLKQYDLPLPATGAVPTLSLGANTGLVSGSSVVVAPDAKRLWVMDAKSEKVFAFDLPLTAAAVPSVVIDVPFHVVDGAFDTAGNLWLCGNSPAGLVKLTAPLTATSVAGPVIVVPGTEVPRTLTVDADDRILIGVDRTGGLAVFAPNPTSTSAPAFVNSVVRDPTGVLSTGGVVYVTEPSPAREVKMFAAPFAASSLPIGASAKVYQPGKLALTPTGDLAVASLDGVTVLKAPAFQTVAATVDWGSDGMSRKVWGVAFGP